MTKITSRSVLPTRVMPEGARSVLAMEAAIHGLEFLVSPLALGDSNFWSVTATATGHSGRAAFLLTASRDWSRLACFEDDVFLREFVVDLLEERGLT